MTGIRRFFLRVVSFFRSGSAEAELAREIDSHLHLIEDGLVARGMSPDEARLAARRAFGGVEQAKEHHREARSFRLLGESWLDFKLGARMLVKHPGLSLAAGTGMAVAIAIAAAAFALVETIVSAPLPLAEGDRIVSLQLWDPATRDPELRILHDFVSWRDRMETVSDVSAFRMFSRNLIVDGVSPEAIEVAEMSASGFRVARVPPLAGRFLLDVDEKAGAPPVVVVGYDAWRRLLSSDPGVIGRNIRLGTASHTVVGIMPEGFRFPLNQDAWVPFTADPASYPRLQGPAMFVFGRLRPGETIESAQAEIAAVSFGAASGAVVSSDAAGSPRGPSEILRPQVLPYTRPFVDMDDPENIVAVELGRFMVVLLLLAVCVNVAILIYTRTAGRRAEIAVRTALGASRSRIVMQLFLEAAVLSLAAAAVGLGIAAWGLDCLDAALAGFRSELPFWIQFGLSKGTVVYVLVLTILAAAIIGALPAMKATGRRMKHSLTDAGAGGARMQLGRTYTALIVTQVAFTVALLPGAVFNAWDSVRHAVAATDARAAEFLTARLIMDRDIRPGDDTDEDRDFAGRYRVRHEELVRRLRAEPGVTAVTSVLSVPGNEPTVWLEAEGVGMPEESEAEKSGFGVRSGRYGHEARFNHVEIGFLETFGVELLAGRWFNSGDGGPEATAVVVNRALAERLVQGGEILGRRIRYVGLSGDARPEDVELERWREVVGVVSNYPAHAAGMGTVDAKLYHLAAPGNVYPVTLMARVPWNRAAEFAVRLREVAASVDPGLKPSDVLTMEAVLRRDQQLMLLVAVVLALSTASVVLLTAAGVYAMMSFTVTERRKEIAVRAALGADRRHILSSIFSRAIGQLSAGAASGMLVALGLEYLTGGDLVQGHAAVVLPVVALFVGGVGLIAALGPARRSLSVQPTDALREQ